MAAQLTLPATYQSDLLSLRVCPDAGETTIHMSLHAQVVSTHAIPKTRSMLAQHIPGIFTHVCYNNDHLPFRKEVRATELGHLFEHMLLEYMCLHKTEMGLYNAQLTGETSWNWKLNARGTFTVVIFADQSDYGILQLSLKPTLSLFTKILLTNEYIAAAHPTVHLTHEQTTMQTQLIQ